MSDFIRIACAVPDVTVAGVKKNVEAICRFMTEADEKNVDLLVFPELCITGATCADLFFDDALIDAAEAGLKTITTFSQLHPKLSVVVGLPYRAAGTLSNCAVIVCNGNAHTLLAKDCLTVEERRWFQPPVTQKYSHWENLAFAGTVSAAVKGAAVGVTFGNDLSAREPVAAKLVELGAEVIVNLAAAPEVVGSRKLRRAQVLDQSGRYNCIYAYCSAGMMESTQDGVCSGHSMIAENGELLQENEHFTDSDCMIVTDCHLGKVRALRRKQGIPVKPADRWETCIGGSLRGDGTMYHINKLPFIPETKAERDEYCREVFQIQVSGLKRRLKAINANPVLGISGGLDSTLALLVAVEAVRQLGWDTKRCYGVTMPCFGTSDRTYRNAWDLMEKLGITSREISIKEAVMQHFADIGHDPSVRNTTYENAQARERTQILMDYSGTVGGIVVGTGDLSELALGWCTYNGDHMSMYGVNGSVPKTLIRWIVEAVADLPAFAPAKETLMDVLDTPISPELLPPDASGQIAQQTEDIVGPYALHDFFLYHVLKYGFGPKQIYRLACLAFAKDFDAATIKKWLTNFYRRFTTQQFKRSCQSDGVKALPLSISPRTDWRMPSEASYQVWLDEIEAL